MNEVIAEIRIDNIFVPFIYISKLPTGYKSSPVRVHKPEEYSKLLLDQGFIWYRDFIAFDTLTDYQSYWIKIAVKDRLEIDPVIAYAEKLRMGVSANVILFPFQVTGEERVWVFGDDEITTTCSFSLPAGNYQLLFENREFTTEEIEAEPNFDCEDAEYDDWEDQLELCLLTFIPTKELIEPAIMAYKDSFRSKNLLTSLTVYDRKLYPDSDN